MYVTVTLSFSVLRDTTLLFVMFSPTPNIAYPEILLLTCQTFYFISFRPYHTDIDIDTDTDTLGTSR